MLLHSILRELIRYGRSRPFYCADSTIRAALSSRLAVGNQPFRAGWSQPHLDVRARYMHVHTHTHTYQSPAASCKYNLEYPSRPTWTLQGRHVPDRSTDICIYLSTSVGLSVVCNDAIADYLHAEMDKRTVCDAFVNSVTCSESILSENG